MSKRVALLCASIAIVFSIAAYWTMPVFGGGAIVAGLLAAALAACSWAGAPRASSVAVYYCIAASMPFWVSRDSTFYFEQGYLWLGPAGLAFAVALLLFKRKSSGAS